MSDNINNMDFKQLRNEVQLLRDELAIMRRKYEDILYNLDDENFSSRLVKQKGDMMTSITQTEESIKLQAEKVTENSQNISTLQITAKEIESTVFEKNDDGTKTSKIKQTADAITSEVTARKNADSNLSTRITQTESAITTTVASVFNEIEEVDSTSSMTDTSKIYTYNGANYHYNSITKKWVKVNGNSIASSFVQTADGFKLTGDVQITEIAQVGKDLHLGDTTTRNEYRHIYFNDAAVISNALGGVGYDGIMISASSLYLIRPDQIFLINPKNTSLDISLAEYVTENGGGLAKFG